MNQLKKSFLIAVVAAVSLVGCGEKQASDDSVKKVAVIAPMTGPASVYGEWIQHGIEAAVSDGIKGVNFEFLDSGGDPKTAVTMAQKALADQSTIALWVASSADTMAVRDIATTTGVTLITSSATSPAITDGRKGVFRTIVNSAQETEALVEYATQTLKPSKVGILYINDAGGKASLDQLKFFLGAKRVAVIVEESFEKNSQDVRILAKKVLDAKPDVVFVTGYSAAMGAVVKGIRTISQGIPILCNQGLETPENLSLPPNILTEIYYSIAFVERSGIPENVNKIFVERYGKSPGLYEITAYDTAMLIAHAVNDGANMRNLLPDALQRSTFKGINGDYRFSAKGNVVKKVAINKIVNGKINLSQVHIPESE